MEKDFVLRVIQRPVTADENVGEKLLAMIKKSRATLEQVYVKERKSLTDIHISDEDREFQRQHGGNANTPILTGMFTPQKEPLLIPVDRSLSVFGRLNDYVAPLFTSSQKLDVFINTLKDKECIIPDYSIARVKLNPIIVQMLKDGNAVINPLAEISLTAFTFCKWVSGEYTFILVVLPGDSEKNPPVDFNSFFANRK